MTGISADQQADQQRESQSEEQHRKIDADLVDPRKSGRRDRDQNPQRAVGQRQIRSGCPQIPAAALSKSSSRRDSSPSRAQSGADRQLLAASLNPDQQQVRNIRAGNQQHQGNRTHQHPQHIAHIADNIVLQRPEIRRNLCLLKEAALKPSGAGKLRRTTGNSRAMSALACSIVTPGFSRASAR